MSRPAVCEDCGAQVNGGRDACKLFFEQVTAKEFSDFRFGRTHRLTVDCYAMQHPAYILSAKSFAAHLTGLCCAVEYGRNDRIYKAVNRWLDGPPKVQKPANLPTASGRLTITHIAGAFTPEEHHQRVHEWAGSIWEAWSEFHALAREWIEAATAAPLRSPGR